MKFWLFQSVRVCLRTKKQGRARLASLLAFFLVITAKQACAQDLDSELQQLVDLHIAQTDAIGANLLVDIRGLGTWSVAGGLADVTTSTAMPVNSKFRIGSVTKVFVSTLILKLVQQGAVTLDTPIESLLPDLLPNGASTSVRQLLNHTSGIKDHLGDTELIFDALLQNTTSSWTPEELVQIAVDLGPAADPGAAYRYSNTGFVTLGLVVEAVMARPLGTVLHEQLFEPLGLTDTSASWGTEAADPTARAYTLLDNQLLDVSEIAHSHEYGNGGVISTVSDLRRFIQLLLGGQIINESLLAEMTNTFAIGDGLGYGLGIAKFQDDSTRFGHDGREVGYGSQLWYFPEEEMTVAVLANLTQADTESLLNQAFSTIDQLEQAGSVVFPVNDQPELGNPTSASNAATTALFQGGAIAGADSSYQSAFAETESFSVDVSITVEPRHIGLPGSIYVVVAVSNGSVYARNGAGEFYLLNEDFSNLTAASTTLSFSPVEEVSVLRDFVAGDNGGEAGLGIDVIVGYASDSDPGEIYFHGEAVNVTITE
ncbi:MAG: beta-lactamase family protein [Pseudomonadales bacterium]|nr:beta-lactamase family protein [Pseudomonadales bacterium]